jgi:hypothetical protein
MATSNHNSRVKLYNTISRVIGVEFAQGIHHTLWNIGTDEQGLTYVVDSGKVFSKEQAFLKILTLVITSAQVKELFTFFRTVKIAKSMGYTVRFNLDSINDLAPVVGSPETRYIFYRIDFTLPLKGIKFYIHN